MQRLFEHARIDTEDLDFPEKRDFLVRGVVPLLLLVPPHAVGPSRHVAVLLGETFGLRFAVCKEALHELFLLLQLQETVEGGNVLGGFIAATACS